jgi:hypothetical protein
MNSPLEELLYQLASDPAVRARFTANPAIVLEDSGLSPEQQDAVLSADVRRITALMPSEYDVVPIVVVFGENIESL